MKTILVPLDGSIQAEQVLPAVRALAPLLGAEIRLLRVIADPPGEGMIAESIAASYGVSDPLVTQQERLRHSLEIMQQNAERYLEGQAALLRDAGLEATIDVRCGPPADVIVETALGLRVAMIAMATHGYSGVRRWALGSVTDKVVHATATPVLVVRGAAHERTPAIKRIMVPLDGSALARQALPLATRLAQSAQAELLLLQAVVPALEAQLGFAPRSRQIPQLAGVLEALHDQAESDLGALAEDLHKRDIVVRMRVVNGHAAEVLVDAAAHEQVDLIVMATHGYSGVKRWALGSVADKVLHAAATPLILIRAKS
jgi:nucleotide-binding universal stress UspA family protein